MVMKMLLFYLNYIEKHLILNLEDLSNEIFEYIKPFLRYSKDFGNSERDKKFKKDLNKVNEKN